MNVKIQSRHVRVTQSLNSLIERQATKIRKLLPTFQSRDLDVHVNLEQLSTKKQFHAALVLTLPQKAIHVDTIEEEVSTAILRAFNELRRRVKRFKSHLNREKARVRAPQPAAQPSSEPTHDVGEAVGDNLEKIENYIRREIYHRAVLQGLPPGILQPHEVVDEVFVEVSSRKPARPEHLSLEQWMFQVARRVLNQKLQDAVEAGKHAHVEEPPETDGEKWEDEPLNFYQPDESLRLEDLMRDSSVATPEEYLAEEETEERLQNAIAELPDDVREPFILYALEGFNSDEAAMILGKKKEEVLDAVKDARRLLRKQVEGMTG